MTILDDFRRDAERVLDRLVDGELGLDERRELLASLEDEPGGWRRCALAFLEAQTWRWQMSRAATEPILAQVAAPRPMGPARRRAFWGGLFAIAASLFVAFALGTRFPTTNPVMDTIAKPQTHAVARPDSMSAPGALAKADDSPQHPWETVTLTPVDGTNSGDPIHLRVAKEGGDEKSPLGAARSALSMLLSRSFEQDGWQVNRQERLMPIDLSDGRQIVVPIEEIDLRSPEYVQF
jgi:hypothetical protein